MSNSEDKNVGNTDETHLSRRGILERYGIDWEFRQGAKMFSNSKLLVQHS